MKLFKKLLPLAAVASTAAVVAPMVTACSGGVNVKDYKTKFDPIAEFTVADSDALVTKYLSESKAKEIIKDDVLTYVKSDIGSADGYTLTANINVSKVDKEKHLVSFTLSANVNINTQIEGAGTIKGSANVSYNVTDMPVYGSFSPVRFYLTSSRDNWQNSTKVVGSVKYNFEGASKSVDTGSKTIEKGTTLDEKATLVLQYVGYANWESNYYKNGKQG